MPQVISIKTFYTSKRTFFYFFPFFKRTSGLQMKNLSNQLSNSSTNFSLGIKLLIKKSSVTNILLTKNFKKLL